MPTITVRISEEEKKSLLRRGNLSETVREAVELYLDTKRSQELIGKLDRLQRKDKVMTSPEDEVRMISEDRKR